MQRLFVLLFAASLVLNGQLYAQSLDVNLYRTYDGTFNNLQQTGWGRAGENLRRFTPVGYADGISAPGGIGRPNPRVVSNQLFAQSGLINDPVKLSDFCWVFGQFIDHDLGLTPDGNEFLPIAVPSGDPWFDPQYTGQVLIPVMRNLFDPSTGTSADNPRAHINTVTAYIDGSAVYGSDEERANWLRTFEGGKLKTSAGGTMLPFNTLTGEYDSPIDPDAPHMDNPVGLTDKLYIAGDPRANENPLLLSFHALFHLEHNYQCDLLAEKHPDWSDEQLFQHARKMVGGFIQSIVYNEWLPEMGVPMPPYSGYNPNVHPQLMQVFTAAAFRLGHTLLNGNLQRLDSDGNVLPEGNLALRDAFFNPMAVPAVGGINPYLKGMAAQMQQRFDSKVVDDVRNFLFGPPGAGGLDLPAINIQRGRERGLPGFNDVRQAFGLQPYLSFLNINSDPLVYTTLLSLYNTVNDLDPWVGFVAEKPVNGSLFGPTLLEVLKTQFAALRDGDRFFYQNDPVLSAEEKEAITNTTFHDIVMRNTGIKLMQDRVFRMIPHSAICENMTSDVTGWVRTETDIPIQQVYAQVSLAGQSLDTLSNDLGNFRFEALPACDVDTLNLDKEDEVINGVSTFDLVIISKHILGIELLDSPYKIIAADVNLSNSVSTLDLILTRRVILSIDTAFSHGKTWRFVPADFTFTDPENPFLDDFPTAMNFDILSQDMDLEFIGVKLGDVNASVDPFQVGPGELEARNAPALLVAEDRQFRPGDEVVLVLDAREELAGLQFTIEYDPALLQLTGPDRAGRMATEGFGLFSQDAAITGSWIAGEGNPGLPLAALQFRATGEGSLSESIRLTSRRTQSLAIAREGNAVRPLLLSFYDPQEPAGGFTLYQNQPNPFAERTLIPFFLEEEQRITLRISDVLGRVLLERTANWPAGMHTWEVMRSELAGATGLLNYELVTAQGQRATRSMVVANP